MKMEPYGLSLSTWKWFRFQGGEDYEQVIDKRHGKEIFIDFRSQKKMSEKQVAGIVHICGFQGHTLLSQKIKHSSGSFVVNRFTMTINGIRYNDLEDGTNLEDVRSDVEKILKNNVVIGININSDLNALDLNVADYTDDGCFDLQEEYKGEVIKNGVTTIMGRSLKSLYLHFYGNCEFQSATHSTEADTLATLQIFREKYIPFKRNEDDCHSKRTENIYNMINRLPRSY
jgi:hypothetical protein